MIVRPELLFLDEPTTGLDPRSRDQLWFAVKGLADEGVTVLLTTQYLAEAEAACRPRRGAAPGRDRRGGHRRPAQVRPGRRQPRRGLPRAHRRRAAHPRPHCPRSRQGDVPMSAAVDSPTNHGPAYRPAYALTDTGVMIARSLRRSLRDPEAFITALALPVTLMLLFVYVFGGAFNAGVKAERRLRQLRGTWPDRAVRRLRRRNNSGRGRDRHEHRHRRPVPLDAHRRLDGPRRAGRGQRGPQPPGDGAGDRAGLAVGWRPAGDRSPGSPRPG